MKQQPIDPRVKVKFRLGNLAVLDFEVDLERLGMRFPPVAVAWNAYQVVCRIQEAQAGGRWI